MNSRSLSYPFLSPSSSLQARALAQLDPVQAEVWLQQGLMGNGRAFTYFELCRLYWQEGRLEEAVAACQAGQVPGRYWLNQGLVLDQDRQREQALAYFQMAAYSEPEVADGWRYYGSSLMRTEQYEAAVAAFEQIRTIGADLDVGFYLSLARAYHQSGQGDKGRAVLQEGIEQFPEAIPLYMEMASVYRDSGDLATADSWYAQLLQQQPDYAPAWSARGQLAQRQENWATARDFFQQAIQYEADNAHTWFGLATSAEKVADVPLAQQAYTQTLHLAPEQIQMWLAAGNFFAHNQQPEQAVDIYKHILTLDPNHALALEKLSELEAPP